MRAKQRASTDTTRAATDTTQPPAYLHHRAKGRAFAYYRDERGERRRRYFRGPFGSVESRRDYLEFLGEWERRAAAGNATKPTRRRRNAEAVDDRLTINELVAQFLRWADAYYVKNGRPTGEAQNLEAALDPVVEMFGDTAAEDFGPRRLREVRDQMERELAKPRRRKGEAAGGAEPVADDQAAARGRLARTTINGRIRRVRQAFRWAAAEELISGTVVHNLRALPALQPGRSCARETERVEPVEWDRVKATLPHLTPTLRAMVLFAWHTGARPGEVCSMRWRDVDRSNGKVWLYCPPDHKTSHVGHERVIGIGKRAQEVLQPFLEVSPDELVFSPRRSEAERRLLRRQRRKSSVPPSQQERDRERADHPQRTYRDEWDRRAFTRAVHRAAVDAEVEPWSPNQLRHAFEARAEARVGLEKASKALGHSTLGTTEHYRSKRKRVEALEVAKLIG